MDSTIDRQLATPGVNKHKPRVLAGREDWLREWVAAEPDITLAELQEKLRERGIQLTMVGMWKYLCRMGLSYKKVLHAAGQDRPDVAAARAAWKAEQPLLDPSRLVFIDETGASTNMTRRYGRCPVGERLVNKTPWGHWKTTTFVGGLRATGMMALLVFDGPMNAETFLAGAGSQLH